MAKRQKEWARRARAKLIQILGSKCQICGTSEALEFDCATPKGHKHHGMDTSQRMSFYRAQWRMGNLALLCGTCNSLKGDMTLLQFLKEIDRSTVLTNVNNTNNYANHANTTGHAT